MRSKWLEPVGLFFVLVFLTGLGLNVTAIVIYLKGNSSFDLFLPILMLLPFPVQLYICLQLWNLSNDEESLVNFFNSYILVMCPALLFYSSFFLTYELLAKGYWTQGAIEFGRYGAPAVVLMLVWAIVNCTRIIIQSGLGSDKVFLVDRNLGEPANQALCNRLDAIDKAYDLLNKTDGELLKVFDNTQSAEYKNLQAILAAFERKEIKKPQLSSAFKEIRAQDKHLALKALAGLLKEDDEFCTAPPDCFRERKTKAMVKALNGLIAEGKFEDRFVSTGIVLDSYENTPRDTIRSIRVKNRRLLDFYILRHLPHKHEPYSPPEPGKFDWLLSLLKMGCDEHRDQKIFEGIQRFPFWMLTFFFTIFVCVGYLFAFSFAFHDKHTLQETGRPALYEPSLQASTPASSLLTHARATQSERRSFFFYYDPASAGLMIPKEGDKSAPTDSQRGKSKSVVPNSNTIQDELRVRNERELRKLVDQIRTETNDDNKVYVEIVGRASDEPVNLPGGAKQVYASNYDLSAARAQNLKFELLQRLRDSVGTSFEIDWFCLPVSNDPSIGGDRPLTNPEKSESIIVRKPPGDSSNAVQGFEDLANSVDKIDKLQSPSHDKPEQEKLWFDAQKSYFVDLGKRIRDLIAEKHLPQDGASDIAMRLEKALTVYNNEGRKSFAVCKQEFELLREQLEGAVMYFLAGGENANKRIVEVHVTVIKRDPYFFIPEEINASAFVAKLTSKDHPSPLSDYLRERLPQTKQLLGDNLLAPSDSNEKLSRSLSDDLNRILEDQLLRDQQPLADLDPETVRLLKTETGKELIRINRSLLVKAYPDELVKTPQNSSGSAQLGLLDYVYFAMYTITTTGYGDIRPTTLYARFLCTMANIVAIFFLVVFFNALLSISNARNKTMNF